MKNNFVSSWKNSNSKKFKELKYYQINQNNRKEIIVAEILR